MKILSLSSAGKSAVLQVLQRPTLNLSMYMEKVRPIIASVRKEGDRALKRFTKQFDGVDLNQIKVEKDMIEQAKIDIPSELLASIEFARENIEKFQREKASSKKVKTHKGVECWHQILPVENVGLYVPGGTAPLVSTVLMLAVPAKLACVGRIVLCTPPQKDGSVNPAILAACALTGVDEVYAVGGAQAIAALAYGTESIPKVEKIAGPGNAYVTAAKALVSIDPDGAAIDMLAGPSELLVIADETANPKFVASDLLSQAEHDTLSQVILLTTSEMLAKAVQRELQEQLAILPRREIAGSSLQGSCCIMVNKLEEAVELSNLYAPEHLSIQTQNPEILVNSIQNAGSVFLGFYAPESVGDYCSGTNHVLPTSGLARTQSGVSVRTFQKTMSIQNLTQAGLRELRDATTLLARTEGLEAHARAVDIRFQKKR
ncbi:histidinol dehydrogenase [Candidatus Peregrinibacteria bacterium CG1_02_54_53]|nr:MAG: histidinol dehydrogenase [Candidatus Peregrinibacteria bacterium CG1_02_54_53]